MLVRTGSGTPAQPTVLRESSSPLKPKASSGATITAAGDLEPGPQPQPEPEVEREPSAADEAAGAQQERLAALGLHSHSRTTDDCKEPSQITAEIILGDEHKARDLGWLQAHGITHVLNCTHDAPNAHPAELSYLRVPIEDTVAMDIRSQTDWLGHALAFLAQATTTPSKVYVHCSFGVSRSSTFVIAHLMVIRRMSAAAAFAFVRGRRSVISPNAGFMKQLLELEQAEGLSPEQNDKPSLDIGRYGQERGDFEVEGDGSVQEAYEEWLANKLTWAVYPPGRGVVCPHCYLKHTDLPVDKCEHCGVGLVVKDVPPRHEPIDYS
jgi:predicted protein tyrosine phosphatase